MLRGLEDGLEMIHKTRASGLVGPTDDKTLGEWQRELLATMVLLHTVMRDGDKALAVAKESLRTDPRWLFTFLRCGAYAVGRRVRTKFRTWRQR
jgi:hypothetical protein